MPKVQQRASNFNFSSASFLTLWRGANSRVASRRAALCFIDLRELHCVRATRNRRVLLSARAFVRLAAFGDWR